MAIVEQHHKKMDWLLALALELPEAVYEDLKQLVEQERAQLATCRKLLRDVLPEHVTTESLDDRDDDDKTGRRPCSTKLITIAQAREILAVLE
jgi:hypothetical protein